MLRFPGVLCASNLVADWIDEGTLSRTRAFAPAERMQLPATQGGALRALSITEQRLLQALNSGDLNEEAMFLAQMAHESQNFQRLRENLNYTGQRLRQVFPNRFHEVSHAQTVAAGGADAIAERIYGGRADLGNTHPGDGARYIGRGYVQLTGRNNYDAAGAALHLDLLGHPELASDPANAARIAVWFWNNRHLRRAARRADVRSVTRVVNGRLNGLADRERRFHFYLTLLRGRRQPEIPPSSVVAPMPSATEQSDIDLHLR